MLTLATAASKKDKKNGKEGRVAAEVTKHAPKFTYVSTSLQRMLRKQLA
jgi:hypothetical protein